jgi:hypothetical protein
VVVTVTVTGVVPEALREAGDGLTVQVAAEGAPVQAKLTDPVNPPCGTTARL